MKKPTMEHIVIVLVCSLLIVKHSDGTSTGKYRTLFDYPSDALGVSDLEGQEDAPIPVTKKSSGDISQFSASDQLDKLRRSIPGEPDVDYPIFRIPPETDFSCKSRATGYYADVESRCQVFRVCTNTDLTGKGFAFLCPNGTLFNQEVFVCDWYTHVDCNSSENHYGKNDLLNMKSTSVSEMMKVANEMMNFPLKTNSDRPISIPAIQKLPTTVTNQPSFIPTTIPFFSRTTPTPDVTNQFTLPTPLAPFGSRIPNFNTPKETQTEPTKTQQTRPGFGTRTFTQEGDIGINSNSGFDRTKTVQENIFSNKPIFISSLGELSNDPGSKFDIKNVKIIKPEDNKFITPSPLTKEQQLKKSLSESFENRAKTNGLRPGENNLANGLQQILQQNPDFQVQVLSGEADLLQFIERILQRNPDLTPDKLNSILSSESDAILEILNETVNRNQSGNRSRENVILEKIQSILNKYKNNRNTIPISTGETDLLDSLKRILVQNQFPIFSGEADLVSFIELLVERNPEFTKQQLNAIISGEADSILAILDQKRQQNDRIPIKSGEAILLDAIEIILQKYRGQTVSIQSPVQLGENNLLKSVLQRIEQQAQILIFSGEADLVSFIEQIVQRNPDFTKEQLSTILSGEADLISTILKQKKQRNNGAPIESGEAILLESIQIVLQKYRGQNIAQPQSAQQVVQSGENNLLESVLRRIEQQSQIPIFSGEADLVSFIEQIVQRNLDFTREQLGAIISGEANSISTILSEKIQRNNGVAIESGEAILLEAIEIILEKYRGQPTVPIQPQSAQQIVQSGENNLLESVLRRIQQQSQIPIFSGEADLVSFIEQIVQRNRDFTREQLGAIISGEANSISTILQQKKQQNNGIPIESGEAILLEAIEIVLQKYRVQPQTVTIKPRPVQRIVQSGEDNLLKSVLERIQQQSQIPIFSGEADLVSFIEQIVQRNPDFTMEKLGAIINGEANSISTILNEKRQRNNGVAIESGEAILLEAIEIVLQKYRVQPQTVTIQPQSAQRVVQSGESSLLRSVLQRIQQQAEIPIFSGEANLISFIEQIVQQNPDFTKEQLSSIISGEADSISSILKQKKQRNNGVAIESGEAILLEAIEIILQKYRGQPQTVTIQPQSAEQVVQSGENNLLESVLQRIKQQSQIPIFSGEADLVSFIQQIVQRNPDFTRDQLGVIINGEANSISTILSEKRQRNNGVAIESGEAILLEAIEIILEKYRGQPQTVTIKPRPAQRVVQSGENNLLQNVLQQIQQQSQIPIFSGEADLVSFIEEIVQRNPEFTRQQLGSIINGEANSISAILNEKRQQNRVLAVENGDANLLRAIQTVLQKYRTKNRISQIKSSVDDSSNGAFFKQNPANQVQNFQIDSGESDLLKQTLEQIALRIPNQRPPIFSGDANLQEFTQRLKQHNTDLSVNQLNAISSGEASSILRIFNEKTQGRKSNGAAAGSDDLLESIDLVLQKYRQNNQLIPPLREPIFSGESDLLKSVQRIQQMSHTVPINFGEADLLQFVRRFEQQNPRFTPNQLSSIIGGGVDSIIQILTENKQKENYSGYDVIESGESDLLVAIQYYVETFAKPDAVTQPQSVPFHPQVQNTQNTQSQTTAINQLPQINKETVQPIAHSVQGQLSAVSSGNSFYQFSNKNQGNVAGVNEKATYSLEQNKQSQFSNQHLQSTQSHITKNQYRGQDNIYTQTAISHQSRSQSTSMNSHKIHYKFTQTVPYQQPATVAAAAVPVQFTQSNVLSTKSPYTYIPPPIPPQQSPYSFASTEASKQVFTYPAVLNSEHEVRNSTLEYRDTDKRQRTLYTKSDSKERIHVVTPDKRQVEYAKDHQSTDLFLKGLHLSYFESNDLNLPDYYRTHEGAETPETEARRQSASINIGKYPVNYQSINKKTSSQSPPTSQAFVFTEIENRPLVNYNIPHPPLQTVYPKSIQNNVVSRAVNRPTVQPYSSPSIPQSLPSIVHEPSNTVATIQNVPSTFSASSLNAQRYPLITTTYSNRESYTNDNAREKVVVKVVKAPGWYLNDANERRSYFDAVAHGLLSNNGLVYVNNVQKENAAHLAQNSRINYAPSKISPPTFSQIQNSPAAYQSANLQSFNGINYWPPCALASFQQGPPLQSQSQPQTRQLQFNNPSNTRDDGFYRGRSSYNVNLQSVGRLAGDNDKYQYNLSSLRQPLQRSQ